MKMKFPFKRLLLVSAVASSMVFIQSCKEDEPATNDPLPTKNMLEVVGDAKFSIFKAAIDKANFASVLSGSAKYTIFAPTDDQFVSAGITNVDGLTETQAANLIKYHMLEGEFTSANIAAYGYMTTLNTEGPSGLKLKLNLRLDNGTIRANNAQVVGTTKATNGIIHELAGVLKQPTVYDMILNSSDLSKYRTGLDLETAIREPLKNATALTTVFVVNNAGTDAYTKLKERQFSSMMPADRRAFLNNTIVPNTNKLAAGLTAGTLNTQGNPITIGMNAGKVTLNDSITVTITDIQCLNGVLHVIDKSLAK
jgi:uncharacterized surface protein with fasciclin (FAS1) repeats